MLMMTMTQALMKAITMAPTSHQTDQADKPHRMTGHLKQPHRKTPLHRKRNEVKYDHGVEHIILNESGTSLDAHCELCGCAVNRNFTPFPKAKSMKTMAQGRPMGLLLAFLNIPCTGCGVAHREGLTSLDYDVRWKARQDAAGLYTELFQAEREEAL